jgi:regulator of replication initiation timing
MCRNLDETSKNIFKENVRMTQTLTYHVEESEHLRKQVNKLAEENERLKGDRDLNELLVQKKVSQYQKNKQTIKEVFVLCNKKNICFSVCLCGREVTVTASRTRGSGFVSEQASSTIDVINV